MKNCYIRTGIVLIAVFLFLQVSAQEKNLAYFNNIISSAYNSGAGSVTLDEGTFYLDYVSGGEFFDFNGMEDFTINAYNTRFIFTSGQRAFTFFNCENVHLKGLTIDYWPLPFTQGTISEKNGSRATIDIHDGYAVKNEGMTNKFRRSCYFIEPDSRNLKANVYPTQEPSENWLNNRQVSIDVGATINKNNVKVGDRIVLFYNSYGGSGHTIYNDGCTDLKFIDLTMNSTIGRAFLEISGGGNTLYDNVKVTYGTAPEGASEPRLFASVAAGIRTIGLDKGPQIMNSLIEGLGDDGCNIQGDYFLVFEKGDNFINIAPKRDQYFDVGDTIVCTNKQGIEVGMATLKAISQASKPSDFNTKRTEYLKKTSYKNKATTFIKYYRFDFEGNLNAAEGYFLYNINKVGEGCMIENTTFRNIRARGILLKALNALIIDNHIENITESGIQITPEVLYWLESGPAKNLTISGNYVRNTNSRPQIKNGSHSAGISVSCEGEDASDNKIFTPGIIHSNISILNNTIEDTPGPGMVISSTRNIEISNNQFKNTNNKAGWQGGANVGVDVGAAIFITLCDSVFLCENEVLSQGVNGTSSSVLSQTVTNVFANCEEDTSVVLTVQHVNKASELELMVFPNPFSQEINIKLNLKKSANYTLSVYDNTGRIIAILFSDFMAEGEYSSTWRPDNLGISQMYLCVLRNEETNETIHKYLCHANIDKISN